MFKPHVQVTMWCLLPGIFGMVGRNSTKERRGQPKGLLAHTIDNNNPMMEYHLLNLDEADNR